MSQMVIGKPKSKVLYSELHFERPRPQLKSQATEAACYFCKSELKEGSSMTSRRIGGKFVLVCAVHLLA